MRRIFFILSLLPVMLQAQSGNSFISLDDNYFSLTFTQAQRAELLENHIRHKGDSVMTALGTYARLEEWDIPNGYMRVRTSQAGTYELKILPADSTRYTIGLNHTACAPICSSRIWLFDQDMNEISTIDEIDLKMFLNLEKINAEASGGKAWENCTKKERKEIIRKTDEKVAELVRKIDVFFTKFSFSQTGTDLIVDAFFEEIPDKRIYEEVRPYLSGNQMVARHTGNGNYALKKLQWRN